MDDAQFVILTQQISSLSKQVGLFGNDIERHDRELKALEKRVSAGALEMKEMHTSNTQRLGAIEDLASDQGNLQRMNNSLLTGFIEMHEPFLRGLQKERDDKEVVSAWFSRCFSTSRRIGLTLSAVILGIGSVGGAVSFLLGHIK